MLSTYREASVERGTRSIKRMREKVVKDVAQKKLHMFDATSNVLVQELHALHVSVSKSIKS